MSLGDLKNKLISFGWDTHVVDGHNIKNLYETFAIKSISKPKAIVANTIKGKGISFMEDDNNWHYRSPNLEEFTKALKELDKT